MIGNTPIYIGDQLIAKSAVASSLAKQKRKEGKIKFVWTRNGDVFVRADEESLAIRIRDAVELEDLEDRDVYEKDTDTIETYGDNGRYPEKTENGKRKVTQRSQWGECTQKENVKAWKTKKTKVNWNTRSQQFTLDKFRRSTPDTNGEVNKSSTSREKREWYSGSKKPAFKEE